MTAVASWGIWISAAALVAGVGKFLDDHHISSRRKDSVRTALIRFIVYVDAPPLRSAPIVLRHLLMWPFKGRSYVPLTVIGLYSGSYIVAAYHYIVRFGAADSAEN